MGDTCSSPLDASCPAQSAGGDRCTDFWRTQRECYDAEELAIINDRERVLRETGCHKGAAIDILLRLEALDEERLRREPTCRRSPASERCQQCGEPRTPTVYPDRVNVVERVCRRCGGRTLCFAEMD